MASLTGGAVSTVDGAMLGDQMAALLAENFVATQVEATLIAHKSLYWEDDVQMKGTNVAATHGEDVIDLSGAGGPADDKTGNTGTNDEKAKANALAAAAPLSKSSRLCKLIGNVGHNTTLTFRFGIRTDAQLQGSCKLPFQVTSLLLSL